MFLIVVFKIQIQHKSCSTGQTPFSHSGPGHFAALHHDGKESGENAQINIFFTFYQVKVAAWGYSAKTARWYETVETNPDKAVVLFPGNIPK